jgi:hypothetical protein
MPEPIVEKVDISPKVKLEKEKMVTIFIDPEMVTMQGIRINGKKYINEVTVPEGMAKDLMRIQAEFWETRKKLTDKNVSVRMKNDFQKEALFLADPKENAGKKSWSRDYGLLGEREWNLCSDSYKEYLLAQRKQHFGY